jgi:hypothetical protein
MSNHKPKATEEPYGNIELCTVKNTLFELMSELDKSSPSLDFGDIREIMHDLVNVKYRSYYKMHEFTGKIKERCIMEQPNKLRDKYISTKK